MPGDPSNGSWRQWPPRRCPKQRRTATPSPNQVPQRPGLEHPVFVWRVLGYRLTDVPEFCDVTALKSEYVNDGGARITRLLPDPRMNRNQISVLQSTLDFQYLVRVQPGVLFHRRHQCFRASAEEGVVVTETWA